MSSDRQVKKGLDRLIPLRKARGKRGRRPTVFCKELSRPIHRNLTKEEAESGEEMVTIGNQQDEEEVICQKDLDTK